MSASPLTRVLAGRKRTKESQAPPPYLRATPKPSISDAEFKGQVEALTFWFQRALDVKKPESYSLCYWLADGVFLCRIINMISENAVPNFHHEPTGRFQMILNLTFFLRACRKLSLLNTQQPIQALDLVEETNTELIIATLYAISIQYPELNSDAHSLGTNLRSRTRPLRSSFVGSNLYRKESLDYSCVDGSYDEGKEKPLLDIKTPPAARKRRLTLTSSIAYQEPLYSSEDDSDDWETNTEDVESDNGSFEQTEQNNDKKYNEYGIYDDYGMIMESEEETLEPIEVFGIQRGSCSASFDNGPCTCHQYHHSPKEKEGGPCLNCGHYPVQHKEEKEKVSENKDFFVQNWAISYSQIEFLVQIGNGAFGEVWQGKLWGGDVAIKQLNAGAFHEMDELVLQDFKQEVSVLSAIRHPNCVLFIAATVESPFCIVTELFSLGSLQNVLTQARTRSLLTWKIRLGFAIDACLGMIYLHQLNIIHRDLKSPNFLVDMNWRLAVADFGLSVMESQETGTGGTTGYIAPEIINGGDPSRASDVFSYGFVLWEIFSGEILENIISDDVLVVEAQTLAGERPFIPSVFPKELVSLIESCWDAEPSKRPIFEEIFISLNKLRSFHGVVDIIYGVREGKGGRTLSCI